MEPIEIKHKGNLRGEKHYKWKGDKVGYGGLHSWIRRNKPKPELCECCGMSQPFDLANISQEYKRDINDFEWLCRSCHMIKDKRHFKPQCGLKNTSFLKPSIICKKCDKLLSEDMFRKSKDGKNGFQCENCRKSTKTFYATQYHRIRRALIKLNS